MEGGIQRLSSQRGRSTVGIGPIAVLGHIRRLAIKNNPIQAKPRFETTAQLTVDSPSNIVRPLPYAIGVERRILLMRRQRMNRHR